MQAIPARLIRAATVLSTLEIALVLTSAPLPAQSRTAAPGDTVRIYVAGSNQPVRGQLVGMGSDSTLRVASTSGREDTVQVRLHEVQALQVYAGQKSRWLRGAGVGTVVGLVGGGAIGYAYGHANDEGFEQIHAAAGAILGSLVGFTIGAVTGSFFHADRWHNVDPARLSLGVSPRPTGGVTLTFSLSF